MKTTTDKLLFVEAAVRYWEDATVDGKEDTEGTLIPFRQGVIWKPVIELSTGRIVDWPQGTTAKVHYKVCDAGEYWLGESGYRMAKWRGSYVPSDFLSIGDEGYGDYIILTIGADGLIEGWTPPEIDEEEWE